MHEFFEKVKDFCTVVEFKGTFFLDNSLGRIYGILC